MKRRGKHCLCLILCAVFSACAVSAEVFWRVPRKTESLLNALGGVVVYSSNVAVNGKDGVLTAYSFSGLDAAEIEARTRALDDASCRVFVIPSGEGRNACVALALTGAAAGGKMPPDWPPAVPRFNATPLFSAVCKATGVSFVTAASSEPPEEAAASAGAALRSAGYAEASPPKASCKIFVSGQKTCLVFASGKASGRRTTVTVLVRAGSKKFF